MTRYKFKRSFVSFPLLLLLLSLSSLGTSDPAVLAAHAMSLEVRFAYCVGSFTRCCVGDDNVESLRPALQARIKETVCRPLGVGVAPFGAGSDFRVKTPFRLVDLFATAAPWHAEELWQFRETDFVHALLNMIGNLCRQYETNLIYCVFYSISVESCTPDTRNTCNKINN